nr:MAG TPA: hypothetical protein [Caudoviricetes sp.]
MLTHRGRGTAWIKHPFHGCCYPLIRKPKRFAQLKTFLGGRFNMNSNLIRANMQRHTM